MTYPIVELDEELTINNINGKITSFTIIKVKNDPYKKLVLVDVILNNGLLLPEILLWKDDEYNKIGQWTDTDIQNALIPVVKQKIKSFPCPQKPITFNPFPPDQSSLLKNTFPDFTGFPKTN